MRPPGSARAEDGDTTGRHRETLELVRAYHAIRDPALRAMVLGLVRGLGAADGDRPLARQGERATSSTR